MPCVEVCFPLPYQEVTGVTILHYNKIILDSKKKMKSTWKTINEEKRKTKSGIDIQSLVKNNNVIKDQNKIANDFNNYFMSIVDAVNSDKNKHINTILLIQLTV